MARILAMIRKEFIQMRRDRGTVVIALMIPIIQLTLFGYAINTDIKHVPMAVLDYSQTPESRDLIQAFTQTQYFTLKYYAASPEQMTAMIDGGKVRVGLVIDTDYAKDLHRHRPARLQVLVDASDPQVAASTLANANGIAQTRSLSMLAERVRSPDMPVDVQIRAWYNPDLVTAHHVVPGLIGVILTMTMTNITAMAIVKEREMGTMEQLTTTPLRAIEIVIGKIVPYILVGYAQVTVALLLGVLLFRVPIRGSLPLLYALCSLQVLSYLSVGLLISTVARSQQQASQMGFLIFLPNMLLAGFMFPREGMPPWAQTIGQFLPLTYFLQIVRGIIMKGLGLEHLWQHVLPMVAIMLFVITLAVRRLQRSSLS
ncbi:MAG: ABC transporter permease [Candidatus Eremiobacteraeota bacterium]|nr:ABC transporter permease [Candidatus Eremiobacteraeota bacterium]MCW5868931.1 ABC transporter permease [Candidatus Eremiobacteraeota bacterium]